MDEYKNTNGNANDNDNIELEKIVVNDMDTFSNPSHVNSQTEDFFASRGEVFEVTPEERSMEEEQIEITAEELQDVVLTTRGTDTETDLRPYVAPSESTAYKPEFEVLENAKKNKKSRGKFKRMVPVALAAIVLGCSSLGVGLGLGVKLSDRIISKAAPLRFQFEGTSASAENELRPTFVASTNDISGIIKSIQDSVVNISMISTERAFLNQTFEAEGSGSGVIFKEDNEKVYIVTNNHVVNGATSVSVTIGEVSVPAKLVGKDATADIAVISVAKKDLKDAGVAQVKIAAFADSDKIEVGEQVIAIGNALGQGKTVTSGIVSVKNKKINISNTVLDVIQTDAAINPGNSGGALVNAKGEVIGINTAKLASAEVEGTGFAISSNKVKEAIDQLMNQSNGDRPYLGVTGFEITKEFKETYNVDIDGFYVESVSANSTARAAGIVPSDIIVGFNGAKTQTFDQLSKEIQKCKTGDTVTIDIIRNGTEKMSLHAELVALNQEF